MISTFTCQNCGKVLPRNPRVKHQKYCSGKECQQARMRTWKKEQSYIIQKMLGHTNSKTTEIYLSELGNTMLNEVDKNIIKE